MSGTAFFVYGTGVRQVTRDRTLELVRAGLFANDLAGFTVVGCDWGSRLGTQFDASWRDLVARTLPPEAAQGPTTPPTPGDVETSTWAMLLRDPLMELRLVLYTAPPSIKEPPPGQPVLTLAEATTRVAAHPPDVKDSGLSPDDLARAADDIATSDELTTDGFGVVPAVDPGLIRVLAQAIVARALASRIFATPGDEPRAAIDADMRDAVVLAIARSLTPAPDAQTSGVAAMEGWLIRFLQTRGTEFVRERRSQIMEDYAAPFLADIAFYLRHGHQVRRFIATELRALEPPVIAIGHSLGGIVLVDLLSREERFPVKLLVTAGTQAPLLYALRALDRLTPDNPGAGPFTPWLNFYNPNDFLAFCAKPLFPDDPGVIEEAIEPPGIPFPAAHSAYWTQNRIYERINQVLNSLSAGASTQDGQADRGTG